MQISCANIVHCSNSNYRLQGCLPASAAQVKEQTSGFKGNASTMLIESLYLLYMHAQVFWWRVLSPRRLSDRVFAWNINNHLGIHYRVCYMTLAPYCTQINPVKHKVSGSQFQFVVQQHIESACSVNQTVWPFWCLKLKTKSPLRPPFTSRIHFVLRLSGLVWYCCIRVDV